MKNIRTFIRVVMPYAVITVAFLTMYALAQQSLRQAANDTPLQVAEDTSALLTGGADPAAVTADIGRLRRVDPSTSLAPFLALYDASGTPVVSQVALNGEALSVPAGVFASADKTGRDMITLEPHKGVRIASVVVPYDQTRYGKGTGYVLAGRSLSRTEDEIGHIGAIALAGWIAALVGWAIKGLI